MRQLTLHEKISIKGVLRKRGFVGQLAGIRTTQQFLHYWYICCGKSIAKYNLS